jgi:hypothetical protein
MNYPKIVNIDFLDINLFITNGDQWHTKFVNGNNYDIHYCLEYKTITIYEFKKEFDVPEHRYKILATQKIQ